MSVGRTSTRLNASGAKTGSVRLLEQAEAGEGTVITRSGKTVARFEPTAKLPRTFLDTNILVYAEDRTDPLKQKKAVELILDHKRQRTGVVSLQGCRNSS